MQYGVRDPHGPEEPGRPTSARSSRPTACISGKNNSGHRTTTARSGRTRRASTGARRTTRVTTCPVDYPAERAGGVGELHLRPARHGRGYRQGRGRGDLRRSGRQPVNGLDDLGNIPVVLDRYLLAQSAIRMADAYATFDNNGRQNEPYSVTRSTHKAGVMWKHKLEDARPPSTASVARHVTGVLKDVVKNGTGTAAQLNRKRRGGQDRYHRQQQVGLVRPATPRSWPRPSACSGMTTWCTRQVGQAAGQPFLPMYGLGGKPRSHGASFPRRSGPTT